MEPYEERVVLKREDNFMTGRLNFTVMTEEEASKLDLTDFEDISESLVNKLKDWFSLVSGVRVMNGVKKGDISNNVSYVGLVIDTRKTSRETLQKSFDAAARFNRKFKENLTDSLIQKLKNREVTPPEESNKEFLGIFRKTLEEMFPKDYLSTTPS